MQTGQRYSRARILTRFGLLAATLALSIGCTAPPGGLPWQAKPGPNGVTFEDAGRQLLRYRYGDVPFKPYIESLRTPAGVNVLLDAPPDHLHHHGLMYAVNVDGVEFWGEPSGAGRQAPRYLQLLSPAAVGGLYRTGLIQTLQWIGPEGKGIMLQEKRIIEAWRSTDLDASLISWQSVLHAPPGKPSVELTGRNYFGLGMRFVRSMDNNGQFFNANGGLDVAGTNDVSSRWCAYAAQADGQPVTVAIFDLPSNPRPARWFTMDKPFAYLSATPDLHHKNLTLDKKNPLRFRFGVALWDGLADAKQIESLYRRWIRLPAAP